MYIGLRATKDYPYDDRLICGLYYFDYFNDAIHDDRFYYSHACMTADLIVINFVIVDHNHFILIYI